MTVDPVPFFSACLSAGAILTGFCGTFMSFRIQREANYCRQPALDFESGEARDIFIGLSHFSSSFLLLIFATLFSIGAGFILPLLALSGLKVNPPVVVGGMLCALVFVVAYFFCEMVHYRILSTRLLNDRHEWGKASGIVFTALIAALVVFVISFKYL